MFEMQDRIGWAHRTQRTIQIGEAQSMVDSFIQNRSNLTDLLLEMKLTRLYVGQSGKFHSHAPIVSLDPKLNQYHLSQVRNILVGRA